MSSYNFTWGHLVKIKWLVTDVTAVGSLDRAECAILGVVCGWACFWPIQVIFVVGEPLCGVGTPVLSSNNFTRGHLMKIEWLVTDVTAVGSPARTECAILGVILAGRVFGQFRPYFWSLNQFVM